MPELDPIISRDLRRLYELHILTEGEIHVEVEFAALNTAPGTLILTNQQIIFVRASSFSLKTQLVSLPLGDIARIDVFERRSPIKKRGVLALISAPAEQAPSMTTFDHIPGGERRAAEIAQSINRQRRLLGGSELKHGGAAEATH